MLDNQESNQKISDDSGLEYKIQSICNDRQFDFALWLELPTRRATNELTSTQTRLEILTRRASL
jgi:hypothetical protein